MSILVPTLQVHPSVKEPGDGLWFVTPPGFVALPLGVLGGEADLPRGEEFGRALAPLLDSGPDEMTRQRFLAELGRLCAMFRVLRREHTVHCSLGLHRDDTGEVDGGVLTSLFTITWVPTSWAPPGVTAARAVAAAEGHAHVEFAELACGPATFSEILRTPTAESGLPRLPLLQLHAHLPHPDGTRLALLTVSTAALAHREHYRRILRDLAGMVSFEDPFAPAGEATAGKGR